MKRILSAAAGAAVMYLFDPQMGRTRRAKLSDQLGSLFRQAGRQAQRKGRYARGQAEGLRHIGSSDSAPASDAALTAKVESEVLSRVDVPKGSININAVDGIVELRGTCPDAGQIAELEAEVRKVTGVIDVHNFLHVPGTKAPNKEGSTGG